MPKTLKDELMSEARAAERKEQAIFDVIHVLEHRGFSDNGIVRYLVEQRYHDYCETEAEALLYLRRYKEKQMGESDERHSEEQARLSGEIDEINKTLKQMENRKEQE